MRRAEPGEEHASPEALDGYQTQNRGTAPPASGGEALLSLGSRLVLGGVLRGLQAAGVGHFVRVRLHLTDAAPYSGGSRLCRFRWGGAAPPWWKLNRPCFLLLWQLRRGPRAGLGQSGVPPRALGLEPRMPVGRWSGGGHSGGHGQDFSEAPPGPCAWRHCMSDFS